MLSSQSAQASAAWMSRGSCQGEDTEIFFPIAATGPAGDQISAAKAICSRCAVRLPCLHYAAETMQDGIWGGTTTDERRALLRPPLARSREMTKALAGASNWGPGNDASGVAR